MATSKNNFFKDHYDWLVALVGLALLAGAGYLYATSLENTPEAASEKCKAELPKDPANKDVPQADLSKLTAVAKGLTKPTLLGEVKDDAGSFLASEGRVYCKSPDHPECRRPIPLEIALKGGKCPWCSGKQPSKDPEEADRTGADSDGDGMTNAWEEKYGLNPQNRDDADQDADGDLFTNLEEFNAKTNPKDPEDHPDYLDDLTVVGDVKVEPLPFWLIGAVPGGLRMEFMVVDQQSYKGKTNAQKGEEIQYMLKKWSKKGDRVPSGWALKDITSENKKVKRPGSEQLYDKTVYTVVLERTSDKFQLSVKEGVHPVAVQEQIDLQWNRGEGKTFTVSEGTEFELNKRKYKVKKLKKGGVTVLDLKTEKNKTIGDGASDQKPEAKPAQAPKASAKPPDKTKSKK